MHVLHSLVRSGNQGQWKAEKNLTDKLEFVF